jgi:hypothetical protein
MGQLHIWLCRFQGARRGFGGDGGTGAGRVRTVFCEEHLPRRWASLLARVSLQRCDDGIHRDDDRENI